MLDTDNPLRRYEMFKNELKKKEYKSNMDGYLRSELFGQHLTTQLEPDNMIKFMTEVAGLYSLQLMVISYSQ